MHAVLGTIYDMLYILYFIKILCIYTCFLYVIWSSLFESWSLASSFFNHMRWVSVYLSEAPFVVCVSLCTCLGLPLPFGESIIISCFPSCFESWPSASSFFNHMRVGVCVTV